MAHLEAESLFRLFVRLATVELLVRHPPLAQGPGSRSPTRTFKQQQTSDGASKS